MKMTETSNSIDDGDLIGLDVGGARIGVARVNTFAKIAEPLAPINVKKTEPFQAILELIESLSAVGVVIGLPRGLDGQETSQTKTIREFASELSTKTDTDLYLIDEAGTSQQAKDNMQGYYSDSIDSIAATIFLEDFIQHQDKKALKV
jgi:putative Holliday junction resolvase